ncbi:MAG: hypothetical protein AAB550_00420 [Patescibacteria group bacterium]
MRFNVEQTKGLASFFFDIAKGLFLGGVGFATLGQPETKLITFITSMILCYFCVKFALTLLEYDYTS